MSIENSPVANTDSPAAKPDETVKTPEQQAPVGPRVEPAKAAPAPVQNS